MHKGIILLTLAVLGSVVFSNTLHHRFIIDDAYLLFHEPALASTKFAFYQLIPQYKSVFAMDDQEPEVFYRPGAKLFPMFCHQLFDEHPAPYHILNILLWVTAAWLVYLWVRLLFPERVAGVASLLLLIHPINGIVVNYKSAAVYSLVLIFLNGSILTYLRWQKESRGKIFWLAASLLLFAIAPFFHEMALSLPLFLFLIERVRQSSPILTSLGNLRYHGFLFLLFLILHPTMGHLYSAFASGISPGSGLISLFAQGPAILWYLKKLVIPTGIVFLWSLPVHLASAAWAWVAFGLLWLSWVVASRSRGWGRELNFSILWLLVGFLPTFIAKGLHDPKRMVFEPHWMMVSSIGFFLFIALLLERLWQRNLQRAAFSITIVLMAAWGWESFEMNKLWSSQTVYCQYWLNQTPDNPSLYMLLASGYQGEKEYEKARMYYRKCLKLGVEPAKAYDDLGIMALDERKYKEAEDYFQLALAVNPKQSIFWNNLGSVYLETRRFEEAKTAFERAIELNPLYYLPRANLGQVYHQEGKLPEALTFYDEYLEITPRDQHIVLLAMTAALKLQEATQVKKLVLHARRWVDDPDGLAQLGSVLASHADPPDAFALYEKALKLNPKFIPAYVEMGKLLANNGDLDGALRVWRVAERNAVNNEELVHLIQQATQLREEFHANP